MKLAAGYIVFDGLETLEASLNSIRSNVDLIIVSYQTISWTGTAASDKLVSTLHDLRKKGLIDHVMEFTKFIPTPLTSPESVMVAKQFELNKRQGCLEFAKSVGATHYMSMDADEFYRESELAWAKNAIETEGLDATAVKYINYVTPTLHRGHSRWQVPFIYRITPNCRHHAGQHIFTDVDPTRGLIDESYSRVRIFERDKISMHHMEMVRKDITAKYQASSRYFPERDRVTELADSVREAVKVGKLQFKGVHLGDSQNPREEYALTQCNNEFRIPG